MLKKVNYNDIKNDIKPGDIIAFCGKGIISEIIKFATRSNVSHIGIVYESQKGSLTLMESLPNGTVINNLKDRIIKSSDTEIWWLPLNENIRSKIDLTTFYEFLSDQEDKPFDISQIIKSSIDYFDTSSILFFKKLTYNVEDFSKFFCSELAAAALEKSGAISSLNASEVTPIDLCMFNIYKKNYYQLKGEVKHINGYNSISPIGWGE